MMSASVVGCRSLTLPAMLGLRPLTCSEASTFLSVTGSKAASPGLLPGSAYRSTMPNGDAANLANGGIGPVATLSGKLSALRKPRPEASLKSLGSSSVYWPFSANIGLKMMLLTTLSASLPALLVSLSNDALILPWGEASLTPSANLRGTGELKLRLMGLIGKHAACAFSRSQLKLAANGSRTW